MSNMRNFTKGFFKENAVFVQLLGMCPTLGVTTTAINGLGMGLATTFVLLMSNVVISLVKGFIPDKVRIPAYIVIIASFVTFKILYRWISLESDSPFQTVMIYSRN